MNITLITIVYDICNYLESHSSFFCQTALTIFWVITALIVWSHLCESCYSSLRPFFYKMTKKKVMLRVGLFESSYGFLLFLFNKMSKKYGFATGRTAMYFWFDNFFWSLRVKTIFYQTTMIITAFSHNDQKILCFWLSRYSIYIGSINQLSYRSGAPHCMISHFTHYYHINHY